MFQDGVNRDAVAGSDPQTVARPHLTEGDRAFAPGGVDKVRRRRLQRQQVAGGAARVRPEPVIQPASDQQQEQEGDGRIEIGVTAV